MDQKIKDKGEEVEILKDTMEFFLNNIRNPYFEEPGEGIEELGKNINDVLKDEKLKNYANLLKKFVLNLLKRKQKLIRLSAKK